MRKKATKNQIVYDVNIWNSNVSLTIQSSFNNLPALHIRNTVMHTKCCVNILLNKLKIFRTGVVYICMRWSRDEYTHLSFTVWEGLGTHIHTHTHIYIYIYIYICT